MATFAFHFAHLSETPCKDCYDLPKFEGHEAVTTIYYECNDKHDAYSRLENLAEVEGFETLDYMSLFVEVK